MRFDKTFFSTTLGLSPNWYYKPNIDYISHNELNITTNDKIPIKCDCIDGSIFNGIREPKLYSFTLDKPPGFKIYFFLSKRQYIKKN